jgi:ATP-dependent DNA helicase RecG
MKKLAICSLNWKKARVIAIIINEGTNKPYKCKDGFFLRIGANSQKLKRDEIVQLINDAGKIHFDALRY